jgi:hypothetical protein
MTKEEGIKKKGEKGAAKQSGYGQRRRARTNVPHSAEEAYFHFV